MYRNVVPWHAHGSINPTGCRERCMNQTGAELCRYPIKLPDHGTNTYRRAVDEVDATDGNAVGLQIHTVQLIKKTARTIEQPVGWLIS